jgi:hypothetical protein
MKGVLGADREIYTAYKTSQIEDNKIDKLLYLAGIMPDRKGRYYNQDSRKKDP